MLLSRNTIFVSLLVGGCANAAVTIDCPESVQANGLPLAEVPNGWNNVPVATKKFLSGMGVTDGPVRGLAELRPYSEKTKKNSSTLVWHFAGVNYPDGKYLRCSYGSNVVSLEKRLPDEAKECQATVQNSAPTVPAMKVRVVCN